MNSTGVLRSFSQMTSKWWDIKSKSKNRVAVYRKDARATGGGVITAKVPTELDYRVVGIIGEESVEGIPGAGSLDTANPVSSSLPFAPYQYSTSSQNRPIPIQAASIMQSVYSATTTSNAFRFDMSSSSPYAYTIPITDQNTSSWLNVKETLEPSQPPSPNSNVSPCSSKSTKKNPFKKRKIGTGEGVGLQANLLEAQIKILNKFDELVEQQKSIASSLAVIANKLNVGPMPEEEYYSVTSPVYTTM